MKEENNKQEEDHALPPLCNRALFPVALLAIGISYVADALSGD